MVLRRCPEMTRVVKATSKEGEWLEEAVRVLRSGGLVAFPTETVYGLGADAFNESAVLKVFEVKKRPLSDALILHISGMEMVPQCVSEFPKDAEKLAQRFWPGPLTLILSKAESVPKVVTGGRRKVGVRWPAHPVAEAIISGLGRPVVAPSANLSGRPSPTRASDVLADLGGLIDLIVDGGETPIGIESTVLDLTVDPPTILRPGAIPKEEIEGVLGKSVALKPGTGSSKRARYSPSKQLIVVEAPPNLAESVTLREYAERVLQVALELCGEGGVILASSESAAAYITSGLKVIDIGSRSNALDVARKLYKALRVAEALAKTCIIAEDFPGGGLWVAIRYRLRSAAYKVVSWR